MAEYLVHHGSDGVVVCGTTGESPTLAADEKVGLFEAVMQAVGDRAKVIAGTGTYDTRESISLTRRAEAVGVHGVMLVVPYYNRPPQEGLYRHFRAIAESTRLPVMLYNVPSRTGRNLEVETVARLALLPNVVAIKEAAGDMEQVTQLRRSTPESFAIYSGEDSLTLPMLSLGAVGVVSVASHVVGDDIKAMIRAFKEGRTAEATELHQKLMPVFKAMFVTTNPIPVKWAMSLLGMDMGPFRLPLVEPTPAEKERIQQTLERYGLIQSAAR
ncbi:MAG TPA: 4-hydroxy-tetrahydrodipicolinate synthase [Limnochordia bacterium]|nr:4-hydroxy-tetrahydrodipicolinate synthase [Limnochordia bacterium]